MAAIRLVSVILILTAAPPLTGGGLYQWTDSNGIIHFSDAPVSGQPAIELDDPANAPTATLPQGAGPGTGTEDEQAPDAGGPSASALKSYAVPYEAKEGTAQRIIVSATLNGTTTAPLAIDTGSPGTIISFALAERLGLLTSDTGRLWITARGIGGEAPAVYTIIDTIQIGDARQQFFLTTVTGLATKAFDGVLGMDFLAAYSTQVDPKNKLFTLQELQPETEVYGGRDEAWWRAQFRELASLRAAWKNYSRRIDEAISRSHIAAGGGIEDARQAATLANQQYEAADKLFDKLNRYAVQLAVPMHWRTY